MFWITCICLHTRTEFGCPEVTLRSWQNVKNPLAAYCYCLDLGLIATHVLLSADGTHARQDSMEVKCQLDEQCQCEILKPLERRRKREQRCLAHSLVGTPNYIAPEVLLRSGTDCRVLYIFSISWVVKFQVFFCLFFSLVFSTRSYIALEVLLRPSTYCKDGYIFSILCVLV